MAIIFPILDLHFRGPSMWPEPRPSGSKSFPTQPRIEKNPLNLAKMARNYFSSFHGWNLQGAEGAISQITGWKNKISNERGMCFFLVGPSKSFGRLYLRGFRDWTWNVFSLADARCEFEGVYPYPTLLGSQSFEIPSNLVPLGIHDPPPQRQQERACKGDISCHFLEPSDHPNEHPWFRILLEHRDFES